MLLQEVAVSCNSCDSFSFASEIDQYEQKNWISLKNQDCLPESLKHDTRFIKQRSEQWFEERSHFKLTGSTLFAGLGLDSLKNLQKHFEKVVRKKETQEIISDDTQRRMDHGTACEIHAIATLVSKFLPVYYPHTKYFEEGAFKIHQDGKSLIFVSPDGSMCQMEEGLTDEVPLPMLSCEFKCPFPNENTVPVHYDIPLRYVQH